MSKNKTKIQFGVRVLLFFSNSSLIRQVIYRRPTLKICITLCTGHYIPTTKIIFKA